MSNIIDFKFVPWGNGQVMKDGANVNTTSGMSSLLSLGVVDALMQTALGSVGGDGAPPALSSASAATHALDALAFLAVPAENSATLLGATARSVKFGDMLEPLLAAVYACSPP